MKILEEIRNWEGKSKELIVKLSKEAREKPKLLEQVEEGLKEGSKVEKGICAEVMEYVSKDKPELVKPYIVTVIDYLDFDASRVKWEASRVIGNISKISPDKVTEAIPKLMVNTKDKSTVVRWSTAFALTEIAKNNSNIRNELVSKFREIIKKENNNGVKNVYLKFLKKIDNEK
ncbi:MAG: hypothetical protein GF368_00910 [Candidatus Aenigmarchaeota archaeon]|nr:hypothetical protein [Candidatus Aenigmarchaeota archaeon]